MSNATPHPELLAVPEGFAAGAPPWLSAENLAADVEAAAESACESCGHEGLAYLALHRRRPASYKAFSVCPACATAQEF